MAECTTKHENVEQPPAAVLEPRRGGRCPLHIFTFANSWILLKAESYLLIGALPA
jgi:hypothetical protein